MSGCPMLMKAEEQLHSDTARVSHGFCCSAIPPIPRKSSDAISDLMLPDKWIASVAVDGFLVVSGFLVTALAQRGAANFIASRVLRLYSGAIMFFSAAFQASDAWFRNA